MVTKENLLQLLGSINPPIVIVIMAIPIVMALPGHAQVRQPQHDRNTDVSELAEVAVDVGMKKRWTTLVGLIRQARRMMPVNFTKVSAAVRLRVGLCPEQAKGLPV
jgi:hypothetical protein